MEVFNVVTAQHFRELYDPLVLREHGEADPAGPGVGDDLLQVSVDKLLPLVRPIISQTKN